MEERRIIAQNADRVNTIQFTPTIKLSPLLIVLTGFALEPSYRVTWRRRYTSRPSSQLVKYSQLLNSNLSALGEYPDPIALRDTSRSSISLSRILVTEFLHAKAGGDFSQWVWLWQRKEIYSTRED